MGLSIRQQIVFFAIDWRDNIQSCELKAEQKILFSRIDFITLETN